MGAGVNSGRDRHKEKKCERYWFEEEFAATADIDISLRALCTYTCIVVQRWHPHTRLRKLVRQVVE